MQDLKKASLTCKAYEAHLPDGTVANVSCTLGRPDADNIAARLARRNGASAYGIVALSGLTCSPEYPLIWQLLNDRIVFTGSEEDGIPAELVQSLVTRLIALFFADIGPFAPELENSQDRWRQREAKRIIH